ncbi:hypothetical protein B0H63DRAFT_251071 [Podospora didyma]|uniref:Transcription factor n=1 Tax=Podospora didyma TaxID=330526 RepID=A0AAE0KL01_9PEZI|nr:hypothetical protein B0H63DRAFT_251071 [Podospora didyma]
MVYCAYCGKSFTRKEHLERHIPSHTNVKPHRCSACQLSFARRDLLQRHHSTFHEPRDPMEPLPGGVPTIAGRTPIACQNCANAKTGCDKRVPCSRCSEKNLPCSARFARRSSKAAVRAAQASAAFQGTLSQSPQQMSQPQTVNPSFMEVEQNGAKGDNGKSPSTIEAVINVDGQGSPKRSSPAHSHVSPTEFPSPHTRIDGLDDFMLGSDFTHGPESTYQDLLVWPDYPMELEMYPSTVPLARNDISMPAFTELSDISATSEPMTASSSRGSIHTRGTSIMSSSDFENGIKPAELAMAAPTDSSIPEFEVVIAAEGAWNLARCNPPMYTGTCPRTAIVHLECLEQKSKQEGTWSSLEKYLEHTDWDASDLASVVPLTSRTRDKMLAITQSFLHKALEIHRGGINGYPKAGYASPGDFNFIVLPPSRILEYFLRSYVRSLSVYYPLVMAGCVDPNEMLQNNQASTLLVLLMIAQGAAAMPMAEARYLSAGLTETCRISLFDIVEKDVELSADPIALRCALLFIVLGAWSGDKWLMDIAMGQRGMYMSMLKHAGMLEPQQSMIPAFNNTTSAELQWRSWLNRESQNRLVHNYVMLDQELSLFHDTAPLFAITELRCPLPGSEVLWMASTAEQWLAAVQSVYGCTANVNPQLLSAPSLTPSLHDLFQDFLSDNLSRRQGSLSPQQLRLILHPLQSLLCHLRQMLSCFSDVLSSRRNGARTVTKASTMLRLEEVQALLQKWYELTMTYHKANPNCPITRCNLVLYHLISLNAVTNFPEIERLARREGFDGSYWELSLRHKRCISQREEAIFHCGQVFRLLRLMPNNRRPSWWSAAMYRATLILWTDSISRLDPNFQTDKRENATGSTSPVAIDQVTPEDPAVIAYLWNGDGVAVLTQLDGMTVNLDKPADVLIYAVKNIESGFSSRVGDGIKRKLIALRNNWSGSVDTMGAPTT